MGMVQDANPLQQKVFLGAIALLAASCAAQRPLVVTGGAREPFGPPELRSLRWSEAPLGGGYRVEADLRDGAIWMASAAAEAGVRDRLWTPSQAEPLPESAALGEAPQGLPAEFAFWLAVAELHRSEWVRVKATRDTALVDGEQLHESQSRTLTTFAPAPGIRCSTSVRQTGSSAEGAYDAGERAERLHGLPSGDDVRLDMGLLHETGWLSWSMTPDGDGNHSLRLHVAVDAREGAVEQSVAWTMLCRARAPILASELTNYVASGVERDGAWTVRVRRR